MISSFFSGRSSKDNKVEDDKQVRFTVASNRMRPHFVNNVLSTIYYLCETDPQEAQKITMNLSDYLMGALGTIENEGNIIFEDELNNVKSYVALEKLRYGDNLHVSYDVDFTEFRIPPLTIEAFVENAVKHGLAEKNGQGSVKITTRRTADGVQIKIEDNGVGFDVDKTLRSDCELHVIIDRIRKLNGDTKIESKAGEGTCVTITLKI